MKRMGQLFIEEERRDVLFVIISGIALLLSIFGWLGGSIPMVRRVNLNIIFSMTLNFIAVFLSVIGVIESDIRGFSSIMPIK